MPKSFTLIAPSSSGEFSGPREEAQHGLFGYFLVEGIKGEADVHNDNQIAASELHSNVQTNVAQQSSGSQTPELQGDADRVLVRFQLKLLLRCCPLVRFINNWCPSVAQSICWQKTASFVRLIN